jgi:protein SCO1
MGLDETRRALFGFGGAPEKQWRETPSRELIRRRHFPDVVLRTHDGRKVRFYSDLVRGKIVTINFMYIACGDGTCPITTSNLARMQALLKTRVGRDIFMYSITINPEYDTPEALRAYAKSFDAGPGWLFLSASPADTELLRRKLGFWDRNPEIDRNKGSHVAMVRYGNEPKERWSMTSALNTPEVMAKAVQWVA